jgi:hypothetical protein
LWDGCQIVDQRRFRRYIAKAFQMGLVILHRRAPLPLIERRLPAMKSAIRLECVSDIRCSSAT